MKWADFLPALDLADAGWPPVLVTGEPGIGKSRLMDEFSQVAVQLGWRVLFGRCWEGGGAPAYWPWMQVVQQAGGQFEQLTPRQENQSASGARPLVESSLTILKPSDSGSSNPWPDS